MIESVIIYMGPWSWWVLALLLMGLEILVPGTFFLWFGISAFVIGTISLAVGAEATFWVWQTQIIGFIILSLVAALFGRRFMPRQTADDRPDARRNGQQLVGQMLLLDQPIAQGRGSTQIGETTWRVSGPDLPGGSRVRVVDADDGTLVVEAVERSAAAKG